MKKVKLVILQVEIKQTIYHPQIYKVWEGGLKQENKHKTHESQLEPKYYHISR